MNFLPSLFHGKKVPLLCVLCAIDVRPNAEIFFFFEYFCQKFLNTVFFK